MCYKLTNRHKKEKMLMKKNRFILSGSVLVLVLSVIVFKLYNSNDNQQNIKFRADSQQDAQVQSNEAMISKSLNSIVENSNKPDEANQKQSISNSNTVGLSNNSGEKPIK